MGENGIDEAFKTDNDDDGSDLQTAQQVIHAITPDGGYFRLQSVSVEQFEKWLRETF